MFLESCQIISTSLDMFVELHQIIPYYFDKSGHVCRIVSNRILKRSRHVSELYQIASIMTSLDLFVERYQIASEYLKTVDKSQHVYEIGVLMHY